MPRDPSPKELLAHLCRRDPRYPLEAYDFLFAVMGFVQQRLRERGELTDPRSNHVSSRQLAEGFRDFALQEFGLMARAVFHAWNLRSTDDIGELMYNLFSIGLMDKDPTDRKEDFHALYDLDEALAHFPIRWSE
jgi:uncharacterized repeat protein (TIGR04138 family)